jgi:RND family efflux transporter MFP subunit
MQPKFCLAIFVVAATLLSCERRGEAREESKEKEAPTVAVVKAERADLSRDVILTAEFRPFQSIDVMAKVAGYVKSINVDVGSRVAQGQLIATLEIPEMMADLARGNATVERSQAEVLRAQDDLTRAKSAHEISHLSYQRLLNVSKQRPGLVAQQEIDDALSKDQVAEAQIAAAQSSLETAKRQVNVSSAELDHIKTMMNYARVTAPFAGVITRRYADTGSMIQAGISSNTQAMPLVQLSENNRLRLILPVPESSVEAVKIGQTVEVRVPTLQKMFTGKVSRYADSVSTDTRTMHTEVDVPNPNLVLIPGMYAEVKLGLEKHSGVIAIPITCLRGSEVFVVTPENRVEKRNVTAGMETADRVEIRSGLQEGEMVVSGSTAGLEPSQTVRPKLVTTAGAK